MNMDRSQARCSFCGKRPPEVQRMVAGPGAAYICESCLQLCNDILNDPSPFSAKALELAARSSSCSSCSTRNQATGYTRITSTICHCAL